MDAETRKTLEALADHHDERAGSWRERLALAKTQKDVDALTKEAASHAAAAAAIRAALREVDRLQAEVADLTATLDGAVDLRKSIEREREEALYQADALTQQVATLTTERDEAHRLAVESKRKTDAAYAHADLIQSEMTTATDDCPHPSDTWTTCSACHLKVMREREEARAQVADLEARAIPKAWVDNARTLTLEIERHNFTGRRIQYFKPRGAELCSVTDVGDHHEPIDFPTLSAALSAAKEAT